MWKTALTVLMPMVFAGASSAESLSTLELADGEASPWGMNDTPAYGQIVRFGSDVVARTFKFRLDDGNAPVSFDVSIHPWSLESVMGPAVASYSGASEGSDGFQDYSIDLAELALPAGDYAILVEATSLGTAKFATTENGLGSGAWLYQNTDPESALTEPWFVSVNSDLAFEVVYDPVIYEPATE